MGVTDETILFNFGSAPAKSIEEVAPLIESAGARLLVIDVLQKFIRARDLNDYALVTTALEPIMAAAPKFDCYIMLTHHPGKANPTGGDEILGAIALLEQLILRLTSKRPETVERSTPFNAMAVM
jgi:hypothetical protein